MHLSVAQTMAEYGSITARIASAFIRVEAFLGQGNLKWVILGVLILITALLLFRRR